MCVLCDVLCQPRLYRKGITICTARQDDPPNKREPLLASTVSHCTAVFVSWAARHTTHALLVLTGTDIGHISHDQSRGRRVSWLQTEACSTRVLAHHCTRLFVWTFDLAITDAPLVPIHPRAFRYPRGFDHPVQVLLPALCELDATFYFQWIRYHNVFLVYLLYSN